jgi:hypothetical protein
MERRKIDGGEGASAAAQASSSKNTSTEPPAELTQTRIGGKWVVGKKLGSGAFGDIYIGKAWEQRV